MNEDRFFVDHLSRKGLFLSGVGLGVLGSCTLAFFIVSFLWAKSNASMPIVDAARVPAAAAARRPAVAPTAKPTVVAKTDKPQVDLFVMSHCPFGLQAQKAYVPVLKLLGGLTDMRIKFVSYAMHGESEVKDNTTEYCIQKEQAAKFPAFLECYTSSEDGDVAGCVKKAGVNNAMLTACTAATDKQFGITNSFKDKANWLSGRYPVYAIDKDENQKYGVQGSPTLVINGAQAEFNLSG